MKTSKKGRIRIHVTRSIGQTTVSLDCPAELREEAVESAKTLLEAMPESTFQGEGVAITSVPGFGPRMDLP